MLSTAALWQGHDMKQSPQHHVLVTGGAGFIGSNLIRALLDAGHHVRCLDLHPPAITHGNLEWIEGNFTHVERICEALNGCNVVYHLASATIPKTSNDDPVFDIHNNLVGTVQLLQRAVEKNVRKLVFASSGGTVYGPPTTLPVPESSKTQPLCSYGIVKLAIEKYLLMFHQLYGLETCTLRLANPYGANQRPDTGQGVIAAFCHKALAGQPIEIWGDGSVIRDYIHITDVVAAMLKTLDSNCGGTVLNVGSGKGASLNDIITHIETACGHPIDRIYKASRPFDVPAIYLDVRLAQATLGWSPSTNLQDGIKQTLEANRR